MKVFPTPEQQRVLDMGMGPLRIAAGAGTGKTTTIALLVTDLLNRGLVEPEQVLGITFTNKATSELSERIRLEAQSAPGREVEVHTYHGFAAQILREYGALVGVERNAAVITPTFSRQLLHSVVATTAFDHFDVTPPQAVGRLRAFASQLGDHLLEAEDVPIPDEVTLDGPWPVRTDMLRGLRAYAEEKRRLGVTDYADLILRAYRLVKSHADVAERTRRRYRLVVLDEYQDTNPAQRELLRVLFPPGHAVVAVGDPDQTIYEWRGASLENFASFPIHFPTVGGPAPTTPLTLNRRSDQMIIEVANAVRTRIESGSSPLRPADEADRGRVVTWWAPDSVTESAWIAEQLADLHQQGVDWREMAILVRKNRSIPLLHDALKQADIPVEVANMGGLLTIPEVADLHAWLRILHSPEDSPALLRLLFGSRYRLGIADIRPLSDWAYPAGSADADTDADHEKLPPKTLLEAIHHLERIPSLRPGAVSALEQFQSEYRQLLEAAQGVSLVELCRRVLDVTDAWQDIEAMPEAARLSARLNLYRFLDLAEEWSPLEGRPSLGAMLEYLTAMESEEAEELDAARLSGEDAVGLLTVHRAKGLEWDVVVLPALCHENFPSKAQVFDNPYRHPYFLPYECRLDRDSLPPLSPEATTEHANGLLRARHEKQEWRIAYVGVTRARRILIATGAYWYGPAPTSEPKKPSALFELVEGVDGVERRPPADKPPRPEVLRLELGGSGPDPLFAEGWDGALRHTIEQPEWPAQLATALGIARSFSSELDRLQQMLFELPEGGYADPTPAAVTTSVTGLVTYATCPLRYFWSEVDRLPRRPSAAARRGVAVHRRIELHNRGQMPLEEADPSYFDLPEADHSDGVRPYQSFLASRFAQSLPLLVEAPFELLVNEQVVVKGRIDAVYQHQPGHWEVVDFKSGRPSPQPARQVQLQAYALAVAEVPFTTSRPSRVTATFAHLGDGLVEESVEVDNPWMEAARADLNRLADGITGSQFPATPSTACRSCDFVRFCEEGRRHLGEHR